MCYVKVKCDVGVELLLKLYFNLLKKCFFNQILMVFDVLKDNSF